MAQRTGKQGDDAWLPSACLKAISPLTVIPQRSCCGFCMMGSFHTSKMPMALFTEAGMIAPVPPPNIDQLMTRNCAIA